MTLTIEQVMEYLLANRAEGLSPSVLAEVFDRLVWSLKDEGTGLLLVRDDWLRSESRERVEIALAMQDVFPFGTLAEMTAVLERISARWPEFAPRCQQLITNRQSTESRGEPSR